MVRGLLERWPLIRQIRTGSDGTGAEAMSERTRNLLPKNKDAEFTRSICPYCGVGCGQMIYPQRRRADLDRGRSRRRRFRAAISAPRAPTPSSCTLIPTA